MFGHQGAHMSGLEALFDSILLQKDMMKYHLVQLDPEELRMMGNKFYRSNDHWHAISAYTKSLARAPAGSELRGLAYANRSAVLLTLGYYEECIRDAKIAMENNYPENLAQKLHMRMAVAYKALGKEAEAQESLEVALKLIEDRKMRPEVEEAVIKSLRDELEEDHVPQVPHMLVKYAEPPQLSYGPNPEDPRLSAAVTASDGFLTHTFKANRNINVGDVILVEEPVIYETTCVVSEGEAAWIYCSECLKLCVNLKPCSTCSWACYCSEECASRAWEKFHKNECSAKQKVLETLIKKK
ncbi:SET and MYND domain-containing protein 4-like isoform X2 [Neocloeon triangulifer]|uniref:SET and MYND domain-containing protein 4-like isoform X2 n=1 Tax=Neocloeon triangulifer TaxID=2078957 RepID=UPI00286EBC79|nr:SET and MYND domain-containing protein 4-like isoform X2 [Neocloeon triangulifer]XP_059490875.1 SET and MYND domain-containing protein 4-like isoform X2 [Neocloeon triangulifer]XP_059490883.1 SET and MYND domain-containing protein 4-like isoform X2 [Neocloeon triangulifer]XP_059490892.1 SET and MYND domain-containing protein 4-like isoform X2 [Neocloeon triangulifer]XP_059490901.1 SET and MYND domain-containing protein 4-like isoform X2 [Neocloeon triangulifer]XP_059490909.1 SET and MYND do